MSNLNLQPILSRTWVHYKEKFISNGQVIDSDTDYTTSEGQSYALLRALYMEDQETFHKIWDFTKTKLQVRKEDKLIAWRLKRDGDGNFTSIDEMNATDADLDIAFALALASKKSSWDKDRVKIYREEATTLIQEIFKHRVVNLGTELALLPFNSQKWRNIEILNPSYFCPAYYDFFTQFDKGNDWEKLRKDTYKILSEVQTSNGLFPDWVKYDYETKKYSKTKGIEYNPGPDKYSFDAFRTFFRVAVDMKFNKAKEGETLLAKALPFFESEYSTWNIVMAEYSLEGEPIVNYETPSTNVAPLVILEQFKKELFDKFFKDKLYIKVHDNILEKDGNYYGSNWSWFALAYVHELGKKK